MPESSGSGVRLVRARERDDEVAALAERLGGQVGIEGVLADLNREAQVTRVPGKAVWGFKWAEDDSRSQRWFPQGITTSADHGSPEELDGRHLVCTSWYSQDVNGIHKGARITFVDVTDRRRPRYRHVLLVEPVIGANAMVDVVPVKIHAGGIVWHGPYLHVAATARGIYSFCPDDIMRVVANGDPQQVGVRDNGRVDSFGYRYVLPVRFTYDALADDGLEKLRYSFLALDRSMSPHHLVAGEHGDREMTRRLVSYELDPESFLIREHQDGHARPLSMHEAGIRAMQGAAVVGGTYYVTTSAGRFRRGSLWVGRPGDFKRFARALPIGPEDITYWPSTGQLWSLTEYPGRRYVFAMDRADFDVKATTSSAVQ